MSVFPGAPHVAFFAPVLTKAFAGVSVFETFGGAVIPTDRQISIFASGGFTSLTAVPSYLVHWLRRARQLHAEGKIPPLTKFKAVLVGAEPLSERAPQGTSTRSSPSSAPIRSSRCTRRSA